MRLNDVARWEHVAKSRSGWDERNALLATFIPDGAAIVDLGAGAQTLRDYVADATCYQAVDLIPGPDVIQADFNAGELPELPRRYDLAVCSGLLEYLVDLERFFAHLPQLAGTALLTYAPLTAGQSRSARAAMGWANHLTRLDIIGLIEAAGYRWTLLREWRAQVLFVTYLDDGPAPLIGQRAMPQSEAAWEESFALLAGDDRPPADGDLHRGAWAQAQRAARARGDLERSRERRLARLPRWHWTADADEWDEQAARLAAVAAGQPVPAELRAWADEQRMARKQGALDVTRVVRLAAIPGWIWNPDVARWTEGLAALRTFARAHGHAAVPAGFVQDGFELGAWIRAQRKAHAADELAAERAEMLAELPGWGWSEADAWWARALLALAAFVDREGHASIPPGVIEAGLDLGAWLARQRAAHASGELDDDRVRDLERFDALTVEPDELRWQEGLLELKRHTADAGPSGTPADESAYPATLAAWVREQRALRRAGTLAPRRTAALDGVPGFALDPRRAVWEHRFGALCRYAQLTGHASPTRDECADGEPIGRWVAHQRGARRQGRLDASRAARLDALPGWAWTSEQGGFERSFAALGAYASRQGFAIVEADEPELFAFTVRARRRHAAGELAGVDALRLDGLPGWTWQPLPEWAIPGLRALGSFIAREGHASVPRDQVEGGFDLGGWLSQLAVDHAERPLPAEVGRLLQEHFRWARSDEHPGWSTSYRGLVERARTRRASSVAD